jgi:uncharacterized protein
LISWILPAQIAERPQPAKLYNNLSKEFPDFLNQQEAAQLEEKLEVFSNETSNQICVVIVDDLNGYEAADYATRLGTEWGVGKKEVNNGIVILVKPTGGQGGRDLFIAVGYGLEGAIPDLATKRIRDEQMYPYLKNGENFAALDNATDVLMKLAKGEIDVKDYTRQARRRGPGGFGTAAIIIIIIIILIIKMFRGGGGGRGYTFGRGGRNIYWGGGIGGFGGGSSWGGGSSSGGGWGGFGGGSFGGGGSGGKW